jgi:hypothetical protein
MGEVEELQWEDMRCMANLGCNKTYRKKKHLRRRRLNEHIFMQRQVGGNLELRHPHCVCNIKVQCKEVKNTTS